MLLLALMLLCVACVTLSQGYWLYNSYQGRRDRLFREVSDAVDRAYKKVGLIAPAERPADTTGDPADRLAKLMGGFYEFGKNMEVLEQATSDTTQREIDLTLDGKTVRIQRDKEAVRKLLFDQLKGVVGTVSPGFSEDANVRRRIRQIHRQARSDLRQRHIDAEFYLQIVTVTGNEPLHTYPAEIPPDVTQLSGAHAVFADQPAMLQTLAAEPATALLGSMWWLFAVALLLVGLVVAGFVVMMRTILAQDRLAQVKTDFVNNMTHELKTPIATVAAAIEAMERFRALDDPEKTTTYLRLSREQLARLGKLVNKILDIASLERRQIDLHPERIHVDELILPIVEQFRLTTGKQVYVQYDNRLTSAYIEADRLHLVNVLYNLLDNAVKFSGQAVEIVLRCLQEPDAIEISVQDDGPGIPPALHAAVFEKFERGPAARRAQIKGFGLGLSYVRAIVELQGGKVSLESAPGKGSIFTISIPQKP